MNREWRRQEGESEYEYIYRIGLEKDRIGSWQDIADLLNAELGYQYTECKYRKDFSTFSKMFAANRNKLIDSDRALADLEERELTLKREARKFYDQRQALSRLVTVQARDEAMRACIESSAARINALLPLMRESVPVVPAGATEAILCLTDWHYGMTCDNIFNQYNPDICRARVSTLKAEVERRLRLHNVSILHVALLGDFAHGAIHVGTRVESAELVSDQLIHVSEILAELLHALSMVTDRVCVYSTYGNHMRTVQNKKDSVHADNMEKIIPWWLRTRLSQNNRISFYDSLYEFILLRVCGCNIVATHGDLDTVRDFGVTANMLFSKQLGCPVDIAIMGDKHHKESLDRYGIDSIIAPALCGSDSHANGKRLYANPAQFMAVFSPNYGMDAVYNIKVKEVHEIGEKNQWTAGTLPTACAALRHDD